MSDYGNHSKEKGLHIITAFCSNVVKNYSF